MMIPRVEALTLRVIRGPGETAIPECDTACLFVELKLEHDSPADRIFTGVIFKHSSDAGARRGQVGKMLRSQFAALFTVSLKEQGLAMPKGLELGLTSAACALWDDVPCFDKAERVA